MSFLRGRRVERVQLLQRSSRGGQVEGKKYCSIRGIAIILWAGKEKKEKRRGEDAGVGLVGLIQADQADTVG